MPDSFDRWIARPAARTLTWWPAGRRQHEDRRPAGEEQATPQATTARGTDSARPEGTKPTERSAVVTALRDEPGGVRSADARVLRERRAEGIGVTSASVLGSMS